MDGEHHGKPYFFNGWFGEKNHYFRKHPYEFPFLNLLQVPRIVFLFIGEQYRLMVFQRPSEKHVLKTWICDLNMLKEQVPNIFLQIGGSLDGDFHPMGSHNPQKKSPEKNTRIHQNGLTFRNWSRGVTSKKKKLPTAPSSCNWGYNSA